MQPAHISQRTVQPVPGGIVWFWFRCQPDHSKQWASDERFEHVACSWLNDVLGKSNREKTWVFNQHISGIVIWIKNPADAMLFKLRFL